MSCGDIHPRTGCQCADFPNPWEGQCHRDAVEAATSSFLYITIDVPFSRQRKFELLSLYNRSAGHHVVLFIMLFSTTLRVLTVIITTINVSHSLPHHIPLSSKSSPLTLRLNGRATATDYVAYATAAIDQMQTWYSASTGLWSSAWWSSANVLTMLADFQEYFPDKAKPTTNLVFPTTLAQAPAAGGYPGFINGFYDDELWWVLAWIKVYDVTGDSTYLDTAATIFEDAKTVWGSTPCGGLW